MDNGGIPPAIDTSKPRADVSNNGAVARKE